MNVEQGRRAAGCLDIAISADLIDPGRINIFERWESQEAVETFRNKAARTVPRPEVKARPTPVDAAILLS